MFEFDTTIIVISLLLLTVFIGFDVAIALGVASVVGLYMTTGSFDLTLFFLGSTAYEALREYIFAVVPLFMLMGEFIAKSGAAADVYDSIQRRMTRLPGRLAHATVLGNAVFAFVTGTSLASAVAFTRIAYPQMKRHGYNQSFSLGSIAGSACLGSLIPPSLFMIVWGILTEQSIGFLFIAGVIPGLLLALLMIVYIILASLIRPDLVGILRTPIATSTAAPVTDAHVRESSLVEEVDQRGKVSSFISFAGIAAVIFGVLGGIWVGWVTPTEGAGLGALLGLLLGVLRGMRFPQIYDVVLSVAKSAVPIMVLLFAAQLYARTLAMAGIGEAIQDLFIGSGLAPWQILTLMVVIWFLLGMLIDSISIMLLTVPILAPIAVALGFDPIAFALIGILAIEAGVLTPPLGLLVYAVAAAASTDDEEVSLGQIFLGSTPYWVMLLMVMTVIAFVPEVATYLPDLLKN